MAQTKTFEVFKVGTFLKTKEVENATSRQKRPHAAFI